MADLEHVDKVESKQKDPNKKEVFVDPNLLNETANANTDLNEEAMANGAKVCEETMNHLNNISLLQNIQAILSRIFLLPDNTSDQEIQNIIMNDKSLNQEEKQLISNIIKSPEWITMRERFRKRFSTWWTIISGQRHYIEVNPWSLLTNQNELISNTGWKWEDFERSNWNTSLWFTNSLLKYIAEWSGIERDYSDLDGVSEKITQWIRSWEIKPIDILANKLKDKSAEDAIEYIALLCEKFARQDYSFGVNNPNEDMNTAFSYWLRWSISEQDILVWLFSNNTWGVCRDIANIWGQILKKAWYSETYMCSVNAWQPHTVIWSKIWDKVYLIDYLQGGVTSDIIYKSYNNRKDLFSDYEQQNGIIDNSKGHIMTDPETWSPVAIIQTELQQYLDDKVEAFNSNKFLLEWTLKPNNESFQVSIKTDSNGNISNLGEVTLLSKKWSSYNIAVTQDMIQNTNIIWSKITKIGKDRMVFDGHWIINRITSLAYNNIQFLENPYDWYEAKNSSFWGISHVIQWERKLSAKENQTLTGRSFAKVTWEWWWWKQVYGGWWNLSFQTGWSFECKRVDMDGKLQTSTTLSYMWLAMPNASAKNAPVKTRLWDNQLWVNMTANYLLNKNNQIFTRNNYTRDQYGWKKFQWELGYSYADEKQKASGSIMFQNQNWVDISRDNIWIQWNYERNLGNWWSASWLLQANHSDQSVMLASQLWVTKKRNSSELNISWGWQYNQWTGISPSANVWFKKRF